MNRNLESGMIILITGANGFIGRALCSRLASHNKVIGVYRRNKPVDSANIVWEQADLTDCDSVAAICEKYSSAVVIHCAGIAHQKIGSVNGATYMRVNSEATENLAKAAARVNPAVRFIFLSSISVYGEGPVINPQITPEAWSPYSTGQAQITPVRSSGPTGQAQNKKDASRPSTICRTYPSTICRSYGAGGVNKGAKAQRGKKYPQISQISQIKRTKTNNNTAVGEESECQPSSDYAISKLDAERRLVGLSDEGIIHDLIILRLAPVYDRDWSFNLDRRILAPLNVAYIRFGSGLQKMSALARPNLVDFIEFLIHRLLRFSQIDIDKYPQITQINADENNLCNQRNLRINVCDAQPYEFNKIIQVLKNSGIRPNGPVISLPLPVVWVATRIAGSLLPDKRKWIHSCYEKLASSMVFDNEKMLKTGFKPRHSLETIFSPQK